MLCCRLPVASLPNCCLLLAATAAASPAPLCSCRRCSPANSRHSLIPTNAAAPAAAGALGADLHTVGGQWIDTNISMVINPNSCNYQGGWVGVWLLKWAAAGWVQLRAAAACRCMHSCTQQRCNNRSKAVLREGARCRCPDDSASLARQCLHPPLSNPFPHCRCHRQPGRVPHGLPAHSRVRCVHVGAGRRPPVPACRGR